MENTIIKMPHIGARIIKSAIGVAVCMAIYFIRGLLPIENGMPFYSALAVLWCIQPCTVATKTMAAQRALGTAIGAAYGLAFLLFFGMFPGAGDVIMYFAAALMVIPVIYTTVLINKKNASYFSCVVFLSIAVAHSGDINPYIFVLNRAVDTLVGILVAIPINSVHMPSESNG